MGDSSYPKTAQNAVNRHRERGKYDEETVHSIVNSTPVAHVSFVPDPSDPVPVVLPMIARIGAFEDDGPACCYVHGYVSARMFRPRDGGGGGGVPVCIAATQVLGLVLALTPFNHSYDYRSAVLHGHAELLDPAAGDRAEALWALRLLTDGVVPGRWANSRAPPDDAEMAATRILRVRIDGASAKVRDVGVRDDKKDLRRPEVTARVWTGVVPYRETLGAPVPAETNAVAEVPAYITEHIKEHNQRARGVGAEGREKGIVGRVMGSLFGP